MIGFGFPVQSMYNFVTFMVFGWIFLAIFESMFHMCWYRKNDSGTKQIIQWKFLWNFKFCFWIKIPYFFLVLLFWRCLNMEQCRWFRILLQTTKNIKIWLWIELYIITIYTKKVNIFIPSWIYIKIWFTNIFLCI